MSELRNKILQIVKEEGPVLPVQISRKLTSNTIFAGAMLSELVASKEILISHAKVGGSPVYYSKGQEQKLNMLYSHLPQKEKEAFTLLQQHQILEDKAQDPAIRVALRSIKDFAFPLIKGSDQKLYWKWYLTSEAEAEELLKQKEPKIHPPQEIKQELEEHKTKKEEFPKEIQQQILKEELPTITLKEAHEEEGIITKAKEYLLKRNIKEGDRYTIQKKKEYEILAQVPSELGYLPFYIHILDKKKISEKEIEETYKRAQSKKRLGALLSTGILTKKAKKELEETYHGSIIFKQLE